MEKGRLMMIIIIVLLVVLLGTVAVVSIYVLGAINNQAAAVEDGTSAIAAQKELTVAETTQVDLGTAISTNLQRGADGEVHICKIKVLFRYDHTDEKLATEFQTLIDANLELARSVALNIISDKTAEELDGDDGRAMLADEIKNALTNEFGTNLITTVYFGEWLIP